RIKPNLDPYVAATRNVAATTMTPVIDLHASSIALAERMGDASWQAISPKTADGGVDRTHLVAKSSTLIAQLVANELRTRVATLTSRLRPEPSQLAVLAANRTAHYTTAPTPIDALPHS